MTPELRSNENSEHVGEFSLRRFRLGELSPAASEQILAHTHACPLCHGKLRRLEEEEKSFRSTFSFERFSGGVERACRVPRRRPTRRHILGSFGVLAAAAVLLLVMQPNSTERNRIKGDAVFATLRIGGPHGQRTASNTALETLAPGETLRLGVRTASPTFLVAISVDDDGSITPIYPETGPALAIAASQEVQYLPSSVELTGKGHERFFVVMAEIPFTVDTVRKPAQEGYRRASGILTDFLEIPIHFPARSFSWLFAKP